MFIFLVSSAFHFLLTDPAPTPKNNSFFFSPSDSLRERRESYTSPIYNLSHHDPDGVFLAAKEDEFSSYGA